MAQPRINFVHPLLRARDYQNRPEFDRLCDWWRGGGQGVCALVGIGGAGKTAVADRLLRVLPGAMADDPKLPKDSSLPEPGALFVFSFYDAPNPDAFVAELAAWLDDHPHDDPDKKVYSYEQLLRLLRGSGDCLLVLDGLEKVQDPGLRGGAFGQITDGRLRDFVLRLAEGTLPGTRVIITTRFRLYDALAVRSPLYFPIAVEQLDPRTAVALLRKRGVHRGTDGQLEAVARDQGFHALSVDLAGGYIAHFCDGDPTRLPPDPLDQPAAAADAALDPRIAAIREQERKFARLAERYQEALSRSDPAALALLQRVCLFRLGVDAGALAAIFTGDGKEEISGPELAKLSLEELGAKLQKLAAMRLIEVSAGEKGADSSFSIHPAVRDGFLAGLDAETAQRGHDAACEGLEASLGGEPDDYPSDPATLDLLEEIVHHTLAAGHAQEAFDIYWHRIGGYRNLLWRLGAYERGERICRAFADGQPAATAPLPDGLSENDQVKCINDWALYLMYLGRLDDAARCYERGNEPDYRNKNWEGASIGNLNLADASLLAGHLTAGLRAAEEALRLAELADDAVKKWLSHASRGHARALGGETDAALTDFRNALRWQYEAEGKTDRPLYSNPGYSHTDLLARLGQREEARRLTEANKEYCTREFGQGEPTTPACNLLLADLARERGDLPGARNLLAEAHEWAIARDAKQPLCWSALVRGRIELVGWALSTTSVDRAIDLVGDAHPTVAPKVLSDAIKDGLRSARDCGFGIYHIDLLLLRARVALHEGRAADAERDVRLALDEGVHPPADTGLPELLAATDKECGYAWGIAEARHLLAEALLLQAAQKLGSQTYKPRARNTPPQVRELIKSARAELKKCANLRKRIQDPKLKETEAALDHLKQGILTHFAVDKDQTDMSKDKAEKPIITRNFLKHFSKGGVKCIPILGGLLEEVIFGTLEGEAAAREAEKLNTALAMLQDRSQSQSVSLEDILSSLKQQGDLSSEISTQIDALREGMHDIDTMSISKNIENALSSFLERHNQTFEQASTDLEAVLGRLEDATARIQQPQPDRGQRAIPGMDRVTLIKNLSELNPADLDAVIASIPRADEYVASNVGNRQRAASLVRWAESPSASGLSEVLRVTCELVAGFGSARTDPKRS